MKKILSRLKKGDFTENTVWLERIFKNGWNNLMRNKLLTVVTTLIVALIFFVFNLVLGIGFASDSILESLGKKIDIRAEILPEAERYNVEILVNKLQQTTGVNEVIFIDKQEALEQFGKKYPHVITFLDKNKLENPLPSTIRVISKNISYNPEILAVLEKSEYSRIIDQAKLKNDIDQKDRQEKALTITHFIKQIGWWLNIVFTFVSLLIIFNSINLNIHTDRHEINIMRLVGANPWFIRGGYLVQGAFYAVIGLFLSILLSKITLVYISENLIEIIDNESLLVGLDAILFHFKDQFWLTFFWQLIGAIIAGVLSSLSAIEMYLKKQFGF